MLHRIGDYQAMASRPAGSSILRTGLGWICSQGTWREASRLTVEGKPVYVDLPEMFRSLDGV